MTASVSTCLFTKQGSHTAPLPDSSRHGDDHEIIELIGKQECAKNVAEMNVQTARYCSLLVAIGSSHDSEILREELKRTRIKVCELARANSNNLMSLLKNNVYKCELPDLERLYRLFSSCLEVMVKQIRLTISLQQAFPISTGSKIFIYTGLTEPLFGHIHKICLSVEHLDFPNMGQELREHEDLKLLQRDAYDMHEILYDINQRLDVEPWAMEPEPEVDRFDYTRKSVVSDGETSSTADTDTIPESEANRRRRCICLVSVTVFVVIALGIVAGVCIPLLTGS